MSLTINIPAPYDTVPMLADIITVLHKHKLDHDAITTLEANDIHVEIMAFKEAPPEHQLQLVWDMTETFQEKTA